jgi:hypothetical protein
MMTGQFRYVRWSALEQHLRKGWMVVADLGPPHDTYSVLCWRCDCESP